MKLRVRKSEICGAVSAPSSKSLTHREYIISALADGTSVIRNPLFGDDTDTTLKCLEKLGAEVRILNNEVRITGGDLKSSGCVLDCGNSGTTIRILAGAAAKLSGRCDFIGDLSLCRRPMKPLLDALEKSGAKIISDNGCAPFSVIGPSKSSEFSVRGDVSSQFISSLLISAPLCRSKTVIALTSPLSSAPYVDMTISSMKKHGADVLKTENGFEVPEDQEYHPAVSDIFGDYSSAAFILSAGVLTGDVTVNNLSSDSVQADSAIIPILKKFGADVNVHDGSVSVKKSELQGCEINLKDCPDLFPIVCVLGALSKGTTKIFGAAHLKYKESSRIQTTAEFLKEMGADIVPAQDGCVISGKKHLIGGTIIKTYNDHRIAMAASIAALCSEKETVIDDIGCTAVSYPGFADDLRKLGGDLE